MIHPIELCGKDFNKFKIYQFFKFFPFAIKKNKI